MDLPQLGQVMACWLGGVRFVPQLGQKLLVAGTFSPHLGQMTKAAAGAA
jgi:hypothetical protein